MSANKVVQVTLVARVNAYIAQMRAAATATASIGPAAAAANAGVASTNAAMRTAGAGTGVLKAKFLGPVGLVMALSNATKQAIQFEDEFANVRKTMQESTGTLDQVALGIRQMALTLPVTTTELNQIATVAGQLGIAAADVEEFTKTIAELSIATNLTAEGAAINFARLSNVMGKPIDEVSELGNVVVHLGNNMAAQETEIVEFAMRIAGVGTQMGMTEADILSLSATLPALGLRAEMGGTAITRIMVEMQHAVTGGTEKLDQFAEVAGMSADQFAAAWRSDPANALLGFVTGVSQLSDAGADAFSVIDDLDLSMIRTQDTALRLAGGTEVFSRAQHLANTEMERQTALQTEVAKRMDTTASRMGIFRNNVRETALTLGNELKPAVDGALGALNALFGFKDPGADMGDPASNRRATSFNLDSDAGIGARIGAGLNDLVGGNRQATQQAEDFLVLIGVLDEFHTSAAAAGRETSLLEASTQRLGEASSRSSNMKRGYKKNVVELTDAQRANARTQDRVTGAIERTLVAMSEQMDFINKSTDPILQLRDSLDKVKTAQDEYTETVKEYGKESPEAAAAAFELMGAINDSEQAALDADLSFRDFNRRLDEMVDRGLITADAADALRGDLGRLRDEAEKLQGDYAITLTVRDLASPIINNVHQLLGRLPKITQTIIVPDKISGPRAAGGPVTVGNTYLVGEEGPELWTAAQSGTIIPAGMTAQMMSGGGTSRSGTSITQNIYGRTDPLVEFRAREMLRLEVGA